MEKNANPSASNIVDMPKDARPCPDFDREFERFTRAWLRKNADKFGSDPAKMESRIPDLYLRWLNTPANWLNGQMPGLYFAGYNDPDDLLLWAVDYTKANVPLPTPLTDRLCKIEGAEASMLKALNDISTPYTLRLTLVTMLAELNATQPMPLYIKWIAAREPLVSPSARLNREDDLAEMCAEALVRMGGIIVEPILKAVTTATPAGQETFLDILCNFPGDSRIVELGLALFEQHVASGGRCSARDGWTEGGGSTALIAAYLGKLGDQRALPRLEQALRDGGLAYLDYIEVRNAVEALGGETPLSEPDYSGDPEYESLRMLDRIF